MFIYRFVGVLLSNCHHRCIFSRTFLQYRLPIIYQIVCLVLFICQPTCPSLCLSVCINQLISHHPCNFNVYLFSFPASLSIDASVSLPVYVILSSSMHLSHSVFTVCLSVRQCVWLSLFACCQCRQKPVVNQRNIHESP